MSSYLYKYFNIGTEYSGYILGISMFCYVISAPLVVYMMNFCDKKKIILAGLLI